MATLAAYPTKMRRDPERLGLRECRAAWLFFGVLLVLATACETGHSVTVENPCSEAVGVAVENVLPTGPLDALGSHDIPPHGEGKVQVMGSNSETIHFLVIQTGPSKGDVMEQHSPDRLLIPTDACSES
jgi:hypothetical protein